MKRIFIIVALIITGAAAPAAYADWLGNMVQQGVNNAAENQVQQAAPQQSQNSQPAEQQSANNNIDEGSLNPPELIIKAEEAAQNNDFKKAFYYYHMAAKNHAQPIKDLDIKKKIVTGVDKLVDKVEAAGDKYAKKCDRDKVREYQIMLDDAYFDITYYGEPTNGSIMNKDKHNRIYKKWSSPGCK